MKKYIQEAVDYLKNKGFDAPEIGIVLGTGLGKLVDEIEKESTASYNHIPNFPTATVEFHKGKLIYGTLADKKVIVMQGRFHLYEGYSNYDVTFPIRVMHQLGIKKLYALYLHRPDDLLRENRKNRKNLILALKNEKNG